MKKLLLLLLFMLPLTGCQLAALEFEEGVHHETLTPWAEAETARWEQQHGIPEGIETRFLDRGPVGSTTFGWYRPGRITVVLRDHDLTLRPLCRVRNTWRHEALHAKEGTLRLDEHEEEYRAKLLLMGELEACP